MSAGLLGIAAFVASYGMTFWLLHHSRVRQLIDQPNQRSSHSVPTPRGGGLSMVLVTTAATVWLYLIGQIAAPLALALVCGGLAVAAVGFWDDVRSAPILVRMLVHLSSATLAVALLGASSTLALGPWTLNLGPLAPVVAVIGVVWVLNLFNFMDGIDGIAASEGAFVLLAGATLGMFMRGTALAPLMLAATAGVSCLGFLALNWAPARIFMGDVGSGYLGYTIAVLALASVRSGALDGWTWAILGAAFVADASVTLIRRLFRGERVYQAHRSHAYQRLARRLGSHAKVTALVIAIDLVWLLPCALEAQRHPAWAPGICLFAYLPLVIGALLCGAGTPDSHARAITGSPGSM